MIIAVDLDDVLASSLAKFIEFHNKHYKTKLKIDNWDKYYLSDIIDLSREEELERVKHFESSKHFEEIKPIKGADKAIAHLSKKHKLVIITARPKSKEKETKTWLSKHIPEIKEVKFTHITHHIHHKTKLELCKEIGAEMIIEDNLNNAKMCAKAGIKAILFDYPYNQTKEKNPLITRVKSWDEVLDIIKKLD